MRDYVVKYWLQFLFGLITTFMGYMMKKMSRKLSEQEAIKMGVQALLRDRIIQAYNHYMELGYCPIYARENLQELSKQYKNLGGNGVVVHLLDKINALPTPNND